MAISMLGKRVPNMPSGADVSGGSEFDSSVAPGPVVQVAALRKSFTRRSGERVNAVDGVDLQVAAGEFVSLLGPSGCGKTTLLRCIAGIERPDEGDIWANGKLHFSSRSGVNTPPERRHLSMMFQGYALWPHMTVFENVAFPLKADRVPKPEIKRRVERVLDALGIRDLQAQYPSHMSGGQQQRTALARALVRNSQLVLFDEPLSNVDANVREQLRLELLELQREIGFAAVYVTHDQSEAMELSDRIAVLRDGQVEQLDSPTAVYDTPNSRYVANFIGTVNELPGRVTSAHNGELRIDTAAGLVSAHADGFAEGDEAVALARPEHCQVSTAEPEGPNCWPGVVEHSIFAGSREELFVRCAPGRIRVIRDRESPTEPGYESGAAVWVSIERRWTRAVRA